MPRWAWTVRWDEDAPSLRVVRNGVDAHAARLVGGGRCAFCKGLVEPPPPDGLVPYFVATDHNELWHGEHALEFIERELSRP